MLETKIILDHKLVDVMKAHAASLFPEECCGIMLGKFENTNPLVKRMQAVKRMQNTHDKVERYHRYTIDPRDFVRVESEGESNGQEIIGIYHSHPNAQAEPSAFDRDRAWPVLSYIVIEVTKAGPIEMKSWTLSEDRSEFLLESMEVEDDDPGESNDLDRSRARTNQF